MLLRSSQVSIRRCMHRLYRTDAGMCKHLLRARPAPLRPSSTCLQDTLHC